MKGKKCKKMILLVILCAVLAVGIGLSVYVFGVRGKTPADVFRWARAQMVALLPEEPEEPDVDPCLVDCPDYITCDFIVPNKYSRPGTPLETVNGLVVHYVGNPGTTAAQNRGYFNGLAESGATYASSHFIVCLDGSVIECVPTSEIAYCSNSRNVDTVSIEVCHPDETGKFTEETYASLVRLCAYLCRNFDLSAEDMIRHYDVTGKNCPKYYVEHPDAWEQFRADVAAALAP